MATVSHCDISATRLEHAIALARAGWPVFPVYAMAPDGRCWCEHEGRCAYLKTRNSKRGAKMHGGCPHGGPCHFCRPGKHPATIHGHCDAVTDAAQIRRWWAEVDWNIGIAVPDGVVIVDIDPRNGHVETYEKIVAQHGEDWMRSLTVHTGG